MNGPYFLFLKHMSLDLKLKFLLSCVLVPLIILICLLLGALLKYSEQYNLIVRNVTVASEFSFDFKKNLDHKMYRCVVVGGSKVFEETAPFSDIKLARAVAEKLKQTTTRDDSLKCLRAIEHYLLNLDTYIVAIRDGNQGYDKNIASLERNIYITDELIQESIQEYIYFETSELANLQQNTNLEIKKTIYVISITSFIFTILLWVLSIKISTSITRPIKELCENIRLVGAGDFTVRTVNNNSDEIETLSLSFNAMVQQIDKLLSDVKQEQTNLRQTELKLLQAQINPHFLYNTFDTITWLAEDHQNAQVVALISSLANFFRTTLSNGKDFISIREEKSHIKSYLEIQQARYRDILEYEIIIPKELNNYTVPKLTLQPIIENAIYHGIKNKRCKGKITIRGFLQEDVILLTITDDGIGMSEDKLAELKSSIKKGTSIGFGLTNVCERIKLYYGNEYGLEMKSALDQGTTMEIRIPPKEIHLLS